MADDPDTPAMPAPTLAIPLHRPVEVGGVNFAADLQLREPTSADLVAVDHLSGYAWMIELVARVANVPSAVIREQGITLLNEASAYLTGWIASAPPIRNSPPFAAVHTAGRC